jgi:hypothetical protein
LDVFDGTDFSFKQNTRKYYKLVDKMDCGQIAGQLYGQNGADIGPKRFLADELLANIDYVLDFYVQSYSPCSDKFLVCWTSYDRTDPGHAKVQCQAFRSDQEQTIPIDRADTGNYDNKFYRYKSNVNYYLDFKFFRLPKIEIRLFNLSIGFREGSRGYGISDGPQEFTTRMVYLTA